MAKKKKLSNESKETLGKKTKKRQYVPLPPKKKNGDEGGLLTVPNQMHKDARLIEVAVRKGWNIQRKNMLRNRLYEIAEKTTGEVVTKEGVIDSETKGDELAIKAIDLLVKMDSADIKRVESMKEQTLTTTTVNIQNNVTLDSKQSALAELANKLGARELVINGNQISLGAGQDTNSSDSDK